MLKLSLLSHQDLAFYIALNLYSYSYSIGSYFDGNTSHSAALHTPQTTGGCQDWSYVSLTYKTRTPPRHRLLARDERRIHILHLASGFRIHQCNGNAPKHPHLKYAPADFFCICIPIFLDNFFTCNSDNDDWHLNNRTNLSNHHYMSNYLDNLLNFSLR